MPHLYTLKNLQTQESIEVSEPVVVLGRDSSCDVVISSAESSRKHARLELRNAELVLQDLDSTNGTFLQDRKIRGNTVVQGGDTLTIGSQSFLIITPDDGTNRTIFGARLEEDSSYVLEESNPNATSIRMRYPDPPGWTEADSAGLAWKGDSASEKAMNQALHQAGVKPTVTAAALLVTSGEGKNPLYLVPRGTGSGQWSMGRADDCDITVSDATVSNHHANLVLANDEWKVVDLDSTNGIAVNGKRKKKSALVIGDTLKVGAVEMLFRPLENPEDIV